LFVGKKKLSKLGPVNCFHLLSHQEFLEKRQSIERKQLEERKDKNFIFAFEIRKLVYSLKILIILVQHGDVIIYDHTGAFTAKFRQNFT
jgi:hypothetical protein